MPNYTREYLIAQAKLTAEDLAQIQQCRHEHTRLGFAYQVAFVRLFNRFPQARWADEQPLEIIEEILTYVGLQLGIPEERMTEYARRQKTVSEHQERIRQYLGLSRFSPDDAASDFVFEQACRLEHTHALLAHVKEFLRHRRVLEPADDTLERLIQRRRHEARAFIFEKVSGLLDEAQQRQLDALLAAQSRGSSALHRLKQTPYRASPSALLRLTKKLDQIQQTGVLALDLSWLNNNFQRALARYARRCTATRLRRLKDERRYTVLVCFLRQGHQDTVDNLVTMFDKLIGLVYNRARKDLDEHTRKRRQQLRSSLSTFKALAEVILDASIEDRALRAMIFDRIGRDDLASQLTEVETWLTGKHSHVFHLVADRFSYLRQFAPALIEHLHLESESSTETALLEGVELLRGLNAQHKRKLPEGAPLDFVPQKLRALVQPNGQVNKPAWECALLTTVRDHIKSGNVAVIGSKRFGHLDDFFMPEARWHAVREAFFRRAGLPSQADEVPAYLTARLGHAYDHFLRRLPENTYAGLDASGWQLSKDPGEKLDDAAEARLEQLHAYLAQEMRVIKLPRLLIEVDNELHLSRHFMSATQQEAPKIEDVTAILATILAHGCNIGPYTMSHLIQGISYGRIKHISDWMMSQEAQRGALASVVNAISRLDISQAWGTGQTSSSDGQRFALTRKVLQQSYSPRFNDFALEFYSFIADNFAPYYSMPIECTDRDAPYVLDGLLYNESDLPLHEHYTDTHGYTENNFAAFALLGRRFSPRIRGLQKQRIYRIDERRDYGPLSVLVDRRDRTIEMNWIVEKWDRMGHFYASLESGHATASVAMKRLNGYTGKNHFYRANRELGRVFKTEHILSYMSDKPLRERTRRGLLKGEQLHALARDLNYGKRGRLSQRDWLEQRNSCSCLTLILAAIIYWQAKEIHRVLVDVDPEADLDLSLVEHISPITWDNVILYGEYVLDRNAIRL